MEFNDHQSTFQRVDICLHFYHVLRMAYSLMDSLTHRSGLREGKVYKIFTVQHT